MENVIHNYRFETISLLPTEFSFGNWKMIQKPALIRHEYCLLNRHFSPHLVHAHSKQ